ncbi:unnamed protein product [Owenia fusiformis]|uniref:Uncharacterized protein n=1 Tax=Owenia fusiformis TaxID=6347 RepID=A0A8J1U911_OWEFU|nr:unnamed protein product [Owenia fusiformis]
MLTSKRLAKRSIIGTRVCGKWTDDRLYPGVIQSSRDAPNGRSLYSIEFDDGHKIQLFDNDIIGPGFQSIQSFQLKSGQKVFITHSGREISGVVVFHDVDADDVSIAIHDDIEVIRKIDDLRLCKSRKSARLQDTDTNYSKVLDYHATRDNAETAASTKRRAVSSSIAVPRPKQRRRRKQEDDYGEEEMDTQNAVMDEHMAALVLTSFSSSPHSPNFPANFRDNAEHSGSPKSWQENSSLNSGGFFSGKSETASTPSPPFTQNLSESAPPERLFMTSSLDEGIELDDTHAYFSEPNKAKKSKISTRTMFKCSWPRCMKIHPTCAGIEQHVRTEHLGPKVTGGDLSDHEEEFYYTEIEVSVDNVTQTLADMHTSSPPPPVNYAVSYPVPIVPDHDYQKKEYQPIATLSSTFGVQQTTNIVTVPSVIPIPKLSRSISWNTMCATSPNAGMQLSPPIRVSKPQERLQQHQAASPKTNFTPIIGKTSPQHKKARSDIRKCRKIYGMENRDMWCTQCKWKKACTRFME